MFDTTFGRNLSSSAVQAETDREPSVEGKFNSLKVVIERETKKFSYYWNDRLVATNVGSIHGAECTTFGHIRFQLPYETSTETTTDSRLYVDNVKVYYQDFLPAPAQPTAAPTAEPTPAPTAAPTEAPSEPTAAHTEAPTEAPQGPVVYTVNEDYDVHTEGTLLQQTNTGTYSWAFVPGGYGDYAKVVRKTEVNSGASADDMCIKLPYVHSLNAQQRANLNLDTSHLFAIGAGAGTVTVELDFAVGGTGTKVGKYEIFPNTLNVGNRTYSIARWQIEGEGYYLYKHENWDYHVLEETRGPIVKGQFNTLKFVIDQSDGSYDYYMNGVKVKENMPLFHTETSEFGTLYFGLAKEDVDVDTALYIDNIKIYQ